MLPAAIPLHPPNSPLSDPIARLNEALAGRYHVVEEVGKGGMATVYLADDLRHERKVALKVLKPELAAVIGGDRFLAEIKTTANLHHPHILPLFDSGEAGTILFYVMPYVEGESLRRRLDREVQLPVPEAIQIAKDVADALDYAHKRGVIHRDIKPANVLLQHGTPVVADFGIALAVDVGGGTRITKTGQSLGTPTYMSPEQATGAERLGAGTDIYALGCVLYEMLTGHPPFDGSNAQAIIGKIITGQHRPPSALRPSVPPNVDAAIAKALEVLPADRFRTAGEMLAAVENPSFGQGESEALADRGEGTTVWKRLSLALAVLAGIMTIVALWPREPPASSPLTRTPVATPEGETPHGILDISADGTLLAYEGPPDPGAPFQLRRRDALASTPLPGTEGGTALALSPDGRTVAFVLEESIRVVPTAGGTVRTLHSAPGACCLRWNRAGTQVYFTDADGALSRIAATGAGSVQIVVPVEGSSGAVHGWLESLPGDTRAVYQSSDGLDFNSRIVALDLESGSTREIVAGRFPRFADGFLVYASQNGDVLMGMPFDAERLRPTGPPQPVAEDVAFGGGAIPRRLNPVPYAVSRDGTLVYTAGRSETVRTPAWVSRDGSYTLIDSTWTGAIYGLSLSPSGQQLAASQDGVGILVKDLSGGGITHLRTEGASLSYRPSWNPTGDSVVFSSNLGSSNPLDVGAFISPADGSSMPSPLALRHPHVVISPGNDWIAYRESAFTEGGEDILAVRRDESGEAVAIASSDYVETQPAFSPDGRFLAYTSNQSGSHEVYVRPFPVPGAWRVQVSVEGGHSPIWAHSGAEMFFRTPSNELAVAVLDTTAGLRIESRRVLFDASGFGTEDITSTHYDIDEADERFVMLRVLNRGLTTGPRQMVVVDNLRALVGGR